MNITFKETQKELFTFNQLPIGCFFVRVKKYWYNVCTSTPEALHYKLSENYYFNTTDNKRCRWNDDVEKVFLPVNSLDVSY